MKTTEEMIKEVKEQLPDRFDITMEQMEAGKLRMALKEKVINITAENTNK